MPPERTICDAVPAVTLNVSVLELVAALLIYEHRLVTPEDLTRVNRAFFHVNAVISVGLFVLVLVQLALGF